MNKFEQPSQLDPVSPEEVANHEAQAESMMDQKEVDSAREALIEALRNEVDLDVTTFNEVVSSMNFSDLNRVFEFKARGHKIYGKLDQGSGGDLWIGEISIDGVKIESQTGLRDVLKKYKEVIMGLRSITDNKIKNKIKDAHFRQEDELIRDLTK